MPLPSRPVANTTIDSWERRKLQLITMDATITEVSERMVVSGNEYMRLLRPLVRLLVRNRITFAPTVKFDWTDTSGIPTPRFARHYGERAEGGTGLIVVEATCVSPTG